MRTQLRIRTSTKTANRAPEPYRRAIGECHPSEDGRWSCWPADVTDGPKGITEEERLAYQVVVEHFRHDLVAFWNHSTFFALLQGALISVAVSNLGPPDKDADPVRAILEPDELATLISVVGLIFGLFWALVAWRRAVLIQQWRDQVLHLDGRINRHAMYLRIEPHVASYWWYGPTKLTVALPYVILSIWIIVLTVVWFPSSLLSALFLVLIAWSVVIGSGTLTVWQARRHTTGPEAQAGVPEPMAFRVEERGDEHGPNDDDSSAGPTGKALETTADHGP